MTDPPNFRIVHLVDAPEAAPTLARWFVEEWRPWYGPGGEGDAEADLASCRSRDALPVCLVALGTGDALLGTAALRDESVGSELGVGPWLAGLLVASDHRDRGIGAALVAAIEGEAGRLGFAAIYSSAQPGDALLEGRDWRKFGSAQSLRGGVTVYRLETGSGHSSAD